MIVRINGSVKAVYPFRVYLKTGGITYEIRVPIHDSEFLDSYKSKYQAYPEMEYHVYHKFGQDGVQELYGFFKSSERSFFADLTRVQGVGCGMALKIISAHPVEQICAFIESGDVAGLSKVKGVGKKTAEKIILQLRGTLENGQQSESITNEDAIAGLVVLGYAKTDARKAVGKALAANPAATTDQIIKACL